MGWRRPAHTVAYSRKGQFLRQSSYGLSGGVGGDFRPVGRREALGGGFCRSEEHTSELQSLMRISYAVFCLKKKKNTKTYTTAKYTSNTIIYNETKPYINMTS